MTNRQKPEGLPQEPNGNGARFKAFGNQYEIDKGVVIPRSRGVTAHPYPFGEMEPGDSLFIERTGKSVNISNVKAAAEKRVPGTKWTTRKVEGGFRIWRVS